MADWGALYGNKVESSDIDPSSGNTLHFTSDDVPSSFAHGQPVRGRRTKMNLAAGTILLTIVVIFAILVKIRSNRYPLYSRLDYTAKDTFQGAPFFNRFDYFSSHDPTQGFVHYVDKSESEELGLTHATTNTAVLRVDTSETNASSGRKSVRVSSKTQYDHGLFIIDIIHIPYGCATWSSVWLADQTHWPEDGEIDVVESVNQGSFGNRMKLHTTDGCDMGGVRREETGTFLSTDCLNSTNENSGCGVQGSVGTYGLEFNQNGGGVYAMEFRGSGIRIWVFPRSSVPADIFEGTSPDPYSWGTTLADFSSTECDISQHFKNQSLIINIDLCGTWAGAPSIYGGQDHCPESCPEFVATNNAAFETAYWEFNSIKVYQAY